MSAIDMIREQAAAGELSAFDCMRLMNSIGFALEVMPSSEPQVQARVAVIKGAYALLVLDNHQKGEA